MTEKTQPPAPSSARHRALDPELAALQVLIPQIDITDPARARDIERHITTELGQDSHTSDVDVQEAAYLRPDGSECGLRVYRPRLTTRRSLPALVFLHGGSFVMGNLDTENARCQDYALRAECLVIAVDYRLAPEHPFPAGFDDACLALQWVDAHAAELGMDRTHLAVGGLSAGGALAAGVAAHARDTEGPRIALQLLLFPVLDASMTTRSFERFEDTPILTSGDVAAMWTMYLGERSHTGHATVPPYASPAQLDDLAFLPPTFLCTAEFDPLRDEGLAFAQRLLDADVPVELRQYAATFHSFDSLRATRLAATARRDQVEALRAAFIRSGR